MRPCEKNSTFGGQFGGPFAGMNRQNFGDPFRGGDSPDHHSQKPSFGPFGRQRFDCSPDRHYHRETEQPRKGPFRCGDSPDHHSQKPSFGPFGWQRFDHSPERHCYREPKHPKRGPFGHHHREYDRRGPSERHCCEPHNRGRRHERGCHSPGTNRPQSWLGRNADRDCCGHRGQYECSEYSCQRRCEEAHGINHHRSDRRKCERHRETDYYRSDCSCHASCCDQRRQCQDNHCEGRSRRNRCENCCESEPCCGGNKEDRESERDDSVEKKDDEPVNERENKIQLVILWLLRELFWKTLKGRHLTDSNTEIIITSTSALQRSLELD